MINWLQELWSSIGMYLNTASTTLSNLTETLNSTRLDENDQIMYQLFGMLHFLLGTPSYILFCSSLIFGCGMLVWKVLSLVLVRLGTIIPKLYWFKNL